MGTGHSFKTDLYSIFDYVQNTHIVAPKEIFQETLRGFFEQDSYYHYVKDEWGFPKTPDHTDLDNDAGLNDDVTTRIYIGTDYRHEIIYYPQLLVKYGGGGSKPISMSRNKGVVQHTSLHYVDGYGNQSIITTPSHFVQSGAWDGSISIDVSAKSSRARDEIVELISMAFVDACYDDLVNAGILIKSGSPKQSAPSEEDDRNDKIFKQTVSFDIRTEWRRHLAIDNVIDAINICLEIGNIQQKPFSLAPNLSVTTTIDVIDAYINIS